MKNKSIPLFVASCALLFAIAAGCGKNNKSGQVGAPQAYPPTAAVTPPTLKASSGASSSLLVASIVPTDSCDESTLIGVLKCRLFTAGPTDLLNLVKNVDSRMTSLDKQSPKGTCLSSTATDFSSTFSVPAGAGGSTTTTIPLFFQCKSNYSTGAYVYFGKNGDDWYLLDGDTDSGVVGMSQISGTSDANRTVDGYMVILPHNTAARTDNFDGSTTLLHFKADAAAGTLEFTAGGVNIGFDQAHVKTNATYMYVTMTRSGLNETPLCVDKATLTAVTTSLCTDSVDMAFNLVTLGTEAVGNTSGAGTVNATPANNVDLTQLKTNFLDKLSTLSGVADY